MKEFIDKLISRLEETVSLPKMERMELRVGKKQTQGFGFGVRSSVGIVNQLAEEYEGGWISVKDRLPSKKEIEEWATFLVTIRVHGKYDIMDFCLFGTDGKWLVSEDREVIAWKRQTPYQPKGE